VPSTKRFIESLRKGIIPRESNKAARFHTRSVIRDRVASAASLAIATMPRKRTYVRSAAFPTAGLYPRLAQSVFRDRLGGGTVLSVSQLQNHQWAGRPATALFVGAPSGQRASGWTRRARRVPSSYLTTEPSASSVGWALKTALVQTAQFELYSTRPATNRIYVAGLGSIGRKALRQA
jgi:hypothetical protein